MQQIIVKYNQNPLQKEERKILFDCIKNKFDFNWLRFYFQLLIYF